MSDRSPLIGKEQVREAAAYEVHYCGFRTRINQRAGESLESCKARMVQWVDYTRKKVDALTLIAPDDGPTVYVGELNRAFLDKEWADHMARHVLASLWREASTTERANANARASALTILAKHYDLDRAAKQVPAPTWSQP